MTESPATSKEPTDLNEHELLMETSVLLQATIKELQDTADKLETKIQEMRNARVQYAKQ